MNGILWKYICLCYDKIKIKNICKILIWISTARIFGHSRDDLSWIGPQRTPCRQNSLLFSILSLLPVSLIYILN